MYDKEQIQHELSRRHLLDFIINTSPPSAPYLAGWVHKEICKKLEKFVRDVEEGKNPRLMLFMPPRSGKSYIATERFPVWALGKHPHWEIVASSYSADLSKKFSKTALDISKEQFPLIFPGIELDPNKQAVDHWQTKLKGGYKSVGVGGGLTGNGAHILVIDDPVKDWEEAYSSTQRERVWNWWTSTASTRLAPKSGVLVIMTRWHEDDLAGRLLAEDAEKEDGDPSKEGWEVLSYPAIAEKDEKHRKMGEALHEERFPLSRLNVIRGRSEKVWISLYQQKPRSDEGRYINTTLFKYISQPELETTIKQSEDYNHKTRYRTVRAWDLAVKAKANSDHTAGVRVTVSSEGDLYIQAIHNYKRKWSDSKNHIVRVAKKEKIPLYIEGVAAMSIAVTEIRQALQGKCIVKEVQVTKDKLTRALPWIEKQEMGQVYLVTETKDEYLTQNFINSKWIPEFIEQCQAFDPEQNKQEDDMIDAVSIGFNSAYKKRKPRILY